MLAWRKRIPQWRAVIEIAAAGAPWWWRARAFAKMGRAILTGPVPRNVWRERLRTCHRCPVYDRKNRACRYVMPSGTILGCSCSVPFLALTAAPYAKGCYAREITSESSAPEGWPAYRFASWRAKVAAVWRFLFP